MLALLLLPSVCYAQVTRSLDKCISEWDAQTQMTKEEWAASCRTTQKYFPDESAASPAREAQAQEAPTKKFTTCDIVADYDRQIENLKRKRGLFAEKCAAGELTPGPSPLPTIDPDAP